MLASSAPPRPTRGTPRPWAAWLAIGALAAPTLAPAAEVTDMPAKWRGDLHVTYGGMAQQVGISEPDAVGDDLTYAIRNIRRQELGFRLEAAVWTGVAITVGLPITIQQRISWPAAREMLYEPNLEVGSYANGQAIDAAPIVTGGLQGVWFGAAFAPFSEQYDVRGYNIPASSRLEIGVRTPSKGGTMYGNNRGAAPGGAALRLSAAFSKRTRNANPYFQVALVKEFKATIPVAVQNDGTEIARDITVRDNDTLDVSAGSEIILKENTETQLRAALWFEGNLGYRSWQDQVSGFYLPDVLDAARSQPVTRSPYVQLGASVGADVHINRYVGLRAGVQGAWLTPHNVEHIYSARTDTGSWQIGWTLDVVGRLRLKGDAPTP
jgi:hypothetical protein